MVYKWWGQNTTVIIDSRDGHGLFLLGFPKQVPPAVPITSEEGIAIEHKLLLLSILWELTLLLLLLPNALVTLKICLELITASQGSAARSSLQVLAAVESPMARH